MDKLKEDEHSLRRMIKVLRNKCTPQPPIHGENGVVFSVADKAEAFADNLERKCSPNWYNVDLDHVESIDRQVRRRFRGSTLSLRVTRQAEVEQRIQNQTGLLTGSGKSYITAVLSTPVEGS